MYAINVLSFIVRCDKSEQTINRRDLKYYKERSRQAIALYFDFCFLFLLRFRYIQNESLTIHTYNKYILKKHGKFEVVSRSAHMVDRVCLFIHRLCICSTAIEKDVVFLYRCRLNPIR